MHSRKAGAPRYDLRSNPTGEAVADQFPAWLFRGWWNPGGDDKKHEAESEQDYDEIRHVGLESGVLLLFRLIGLEASIEV